MNVIPCAHASLAQQQAAEWYALLSSGEVSEIERTQWNNWLRAAPEHAQAWALVEDVVLRFQGLPPAVAHATLQNPALDRRAALKLLGVLLTAAGAAMVGRQIPVVRSEFADLSTGTGERNTWTLNDGTHIHLNARSALDVLFDAQQRRLRLYRGEVLVETGHAPPHSQRPLVVETGQGLIKALGTRFMVSERNDKVDVSLFEGVLEVQAFGAPAQRLRAGQTVRLHRNSASAITPLDPHVAAWEQGLIFAEGMPLKRYLMQLAPYRNGVLTCDAAAAKLRVSGVFALFDSDRLLAQLEDILPVKVRYFSRYWIRVEATTTA
ncbi:FecR domain-containing protein [Pectobacterium actinidiae]|uniref:FecR domain-containing protein n=1 Tax=Pectobacterium actinidiae TaxID=1507808 RepID=UPI003816D2AC